MRSIRHTLLVTLLGAVTAVMLAAAGAVFHLARLEIDEIFDYHLRQIALTLRDQVRGRGAPLEDVPGFDYVLQIWAPDGERLFLSRPGTGLPQSATLGFATVPTAAGDWRVYSAEISGLLVQVAQPVSLRRRLAFAAASRTLTPVLLVLPLLALLVWRIVGRALAPLDRLVGAVRSRTPAAMEPIGAEGVPEEAAPLVRAIDDLLTRLDSALTAQRAFVADAAHELRTPLAALALQAQLLESAVAEPERAMALGDLRAGVQRAARVVHQLLALARADPDGAPALAVEPVSLPELVSQSVADHALLAEARGVDLGATGVESPVSVAGDAVSLRTLLANLVDNAVRYTPAGGRVDVTAGMAGGRAFLQVADSGSGIPAAERERVFDRFYRRGGSEESGSGLGLALVKAIASRHRAVVALGDTPGGGLTARVEFPPGDPSSDHGGSAPAPDRDGGP